MYRSYTTPVLTIPSGDPQTRTISLLSPGLQAGISHIMLYTLYQYYPDRLHGSSAPLETHPGRMISVEQLSRVCFLSARHHSSHRRPQLREEHHPKGEHGFKGKALLNHPLCLRTPRGDPRNSKFPL